MMGHLLGHFQNYQTNLGFQVADHFKYLQIVHLLKPFIPKQRAIPSQVLSLLSTSLHHKTKSSITYSRTMISFAKQLIF